MTALKDLPIPPRPAYFGSDGAPPGVAVNFDAFGQWDDLRPIIKPTTAVVHTNAATVEASLQSQINWGNAAANNTKPHYAVNRPQPTKFVPSNRRAIGNSSFLSVEQEAGVDDVSYWTLVIETADSGTNADPGISDFLYDHAEIVARILAYESIVWDIPLVTPKVWTDPGVVSHTDPFPFPYFTIKYGKSCPGDKKKARVRGDVLARANQIRAAWTADPEDDPDMAAKPRFFKTHKDSPTVWMTTDEHTAVHVTPPQYLALGSPDVPVEPKANQARFAYLQSMQHDIAL